MFPQIENFTKLAGDQKDNDSNQGINEDMVKICGSREDKKKSKIKNVCSEVEGRGVEEEVTLPSLPQVAIFSIFSICLEHSDTLLWHHHCLVLIEHGDNLDQSMTTVVIRVLPVLKSALSLTSLSWRLLAGAASPSPTSSPPSHLSDHTHTNTHTTSTNKFNFRGELELELSVSGAPAQRLTAILVPRYTHLSRYPGIPTLISRYTGIQVFGSHSKSGINLPKQRE